jgi:translation elongation factor EF-Tu-like GTPase
MLPFARRMLPTREATPDCRTIGHVSVGKEILTVAITAFLSDSASFTFVARSAVLSS